MDVADSARKRGVADADIIHAIDNALVVDDLDDDLRLHLGARRDGSLREIVTLLRQDGPEVAIHAMPIRNKYRRLLPEGQG